MINQRQKRRLLHSTAICAATAFTLWAAPSMAQEAPPAEEPQDASELGEVIITGSRLRNQDLTANSPLKTVTQEELVGAATLTVETFLNTLPQVVPSVSTAANNPDNNGAANIDLRGLGPNRNIVLMDGRRIVGSDENNTVDVATIPAALIERIELISGGASAVYGADAVAGVVNFILRDDFEGVELDTQGLIAQRGDAIQYEASLTMGGNFNDDRGNAVINFAYSNRAEMSKADRELTGQAGSTTSYFPSGTYRTAGNAPTQAAVDAVFARYGVAPGAVPRAPSLGFGFNGDDTLYAPGAPGAQFDMQNFRRDPSEIATRFAPDFFSYNFEQENILIMPLERKTVSAFVTYEVNDRATAYANALFSNYIADTQSAASPAPTAGNPLYPGAGLLEFTIPVTNPFIPADLAELLASRTGDNPVLAGSGATEEFAYRFRASSLGKRRESNGINTYNLITGVKWEMGSDWLGDAYITHGRYLNSQVQSGNLLVRKFEQLLDSPTGGTEFCAGGFNPFGVGLSPECAAYVGIVTKNQTSIEQTNAVVSLNGPLGVDFGAGPINAAIGAEYRTVSYDFLPDSALQGGEVAGFNGQPPLAGQVNFAELFGEMGVPLLRDRPFAQTLDLTVGYRLTDAKYGGTAHTYKAELSWVPVDALRFRGSYQHAIRAPSVGELFQAPLDDNPQVFDPCNSRTTGGAPNPARTQQILELCRLQGAAVGFSSAFIDAYQQGNAQVNAVQVGNVELESEVADTTTIGAVFRPAFDSPFFRNVSASVDYYNIRIEDVIRLASPSLTVNNCYSAATNPTFSPDNPFCQMFQRGAGDFAIVNLLEPLSNQGLLETSGIDAAVNFSVGLDDVTGASWAGTFNVAFIATYVMEFLEQEGPADPTRDFAGTIGDDYGETLPEWKLNLSLGWNAGPFGMNLRGRYVGEMENRNDRISQIDNGTDDPDATGVDSITYWDLSTSYDIGEQTTIRAGILNLFDEDARSYQPSIDANTDPSTYDVIGRRFFVGLTSKF
jgi:outer membrane receptor protein involved in Fe transport